MLLVMRLLRSVFLIVNFGFSIKVLYKIRARVLFRLYGVIKSNEFTIVLINSGSGNNRTTEITTGILDNVLRIASVRFCIDIETVIVVPTFGDQTVDVRILLRSRPKVCKTIMNPGVKFLDLFNLKNTLETEWKRQ